MRFMMLVVLEEYTDAPWDPELVAAMARYNDELSKAGVLLSLDGLHPPSAGARVHNRGGKSTVTDGPFSEAKEVIGGYWVIQVKSREEAVEWAKRVPGDHLIEVRRIQEMSDFPDEVQQALKV